MFVSIRSIVFFVSHFVCALRILQQGQYVRNFFSLLICLGKRHLPGEILAPCKSAYQSNQYQYWYILNSTTACQHVTATARVFHNSSMSTSRRTGACTRRGTSRHPHTDHGKSWQHVYCGDDFCCLWINAHDIVLEVHLLSRSFQWWLSMPMLCLSKAPYVHQEILKSVESVESGCAMICPYAQKISVMGHLVLPSSPCLPLPHRATLRLPHLNDSRHLAPSNRHNSWDDRQDLTK